MGVVAKPRRPVLRRYRSVVGASARRWRQLVAPHFAFLEGHGFRLSATNDSSTWETWVQYTSAISAVRITRSREFARAEVHLIRLVDGQVPAYPIWVTSERMNWALLDNVLEARSPELLQPEAGGLTNPELDRQLAFWASALVTAAPDFLDGDLTAMSEAETIVRQRVSQHPQQVTVWIPDDADSASVAHQMQATKASVPPEVRVVTARYRRGSWRRRPGGAS
jgi:hypothetical protein